MRTLTLTILLTLSACGPNRDDVIREICEPNASNDDFSLEDTAIEKGYDVAEVQSICREWFRNELSDFNDRARQMNGGDADPFAAE